MNLLTAKKKYGTDTPRKAYRLHYFKGEGANSIGQMLHPFGPFTTNQVDAMINAYVSEIEGVQGWISSYDTMIADWVGSPDVKTMYIEKQNELKTTLKQLEGAV